MLSADLRFRRGDFELRIRHGFDAGVTGLCGPSGSGKSTLLALIAGLLRPDAGSSLAFDGEPLLALPPHRRRIGLVFQDGLLFPHLSVRGNLLYGWRHLPPAQRRFGLEEIAALLEIGPLLERRVQQLSGGERQRAALGRALLYSPRLLLLDEPLSSLDARLKAQILPFLKRVREETLIPMIYVSHAADEVEYLADEILRIESGRLCD
jgi:molybdate transport system ATP-binding protein